MDTVGGWRALASALIVVAALGLSSCGTDEADDNAVATSPTESSSQGEPAAGDESPSEEVPPGTAACADVWQADARLPNRYKGCEEDGSFIERDVLACSSGQRMVRYDDQYYAVLGGTIYQVSGPLDDDRDYTAAARRCRA